MLKSGVALMMTMHGHVKIDQMYHLSELLLTLMRIEIVQISGGACVVPW